MEVKEIPIGELEQWDKNPRIINDKDFTRLKHQIKTLGEYKPLLAFHDPEKNKFIVIGGNTRLRAYRELGKELVSVIVVQPKSEKEILEFSISDNDSIGFYDEQRLADLISKLEDKTNLDMLSINVNSSVDLKTFLDALKGDYKDLDKQLSNLEGMEHITITIEVPKKFKDTVEEYLANGEKKTAGGLGKGVLKHCGLL